MNERTQRRMRASLRPLCFFCVLCVISFRFSISHAFRRYTHIVNTATSGGEPKRTGSVDMPMPRQT
jgi:hypothetical protein